MFGAFVLTLKHKIMSEEIMKPIQYIDFDTFSRALFVTKDVDPVYPFIKSTLKHFDFHPEWFCLAYTTFYSLESAMKFCSEFPSYEDYKKDRFIEMRMDKHISKMGHERRGTQRNPNNQHNVFIAIREAFEMMSRGQEGLLDFSNQINFRKSLANAIPMHGPWATFKVAEVFERALDYEQLSIPDLGLDGKNPNSNDGPIGGLRWLFGREDKYTNKEFERWNYFGKLLSKNWQIGMGEVETALCKWHKVITGNYFVGHDIAEFVELKPFWGDKYNIVMRENFHPKLWATIEHMPKQHKSLYKNSGKILNQEFANKHSYKADVVDLMLETYE